MNLTPPCEYCGRKTDIPRRHKRKCPEYRKPTTMEKISDLVFSFRPVPLKLLEQFEREEKEYLESLN